jgi:hypothetical protein
LPELGTNSEWLKSHESCHSSAAYDPAICRQFRTFGDKYFSVNWPSEIFSQPHLNNDRQPPELDRLLPGMRDQRQMAAIERARERVLGTLYLIRGTTIMLRPRTKESRVKNRGQKKNRGESEIPLIALWAMNAQSRKPARQLPASNRISNPRRVPPEIPKGAGRSCARPAPFSQPYP